MAAIISGVNLGLSNSSLFVLGSAGAFGTAPTGRSGEKVYVNASTGNLVVQNTDELVMGRGPDMGLLRTYNSQGLLDDDNADNWRLGIYRQVTDLTGVVNTGGSTVTRVAEDGTRSLYTYDTALGAYCTHDGDGAYDTLRFDAVTQAWTWTDGSSRITERYDAANGGRLTSMQDEDGNGLSFVYNAAGLITQVNDASGETTFLDYSGNLLTDLHSVTADGQTIVRTRYAYDASNRLATVTVDLSPQDASVADGNRYVTTYTYDGASRRIASISQSDGTTVSFTYVQIALDWRVATYTDGQGLVTQINSTQTGVELHQVDPNPASLSTTDTLTTVNNYKVNSGALLTTDTQITHPTYNLNTAAATPMPGSLSGASLLETGTAAASNPQVGFDQNGNGFSLWQTSNDLLVRRYDAPSNTWGTTLTLDANANTITVPKLYVDASGNAIATWVQSDGTANSIWNSRYSAASNTWSAAVTVDTLATIAVDPVATVNAAGQAAIAWRQPAAGTTTPNNLMVARFTTSWQAPVLVEARTNDITAAPSIAMDSLNNVQVVWTQSDGTAVSTYTNRFSAASGTWGTATLLETGTAATSNAQVAFDQNGNGFVLWQTSADLLVRRYDRATNTFAAAVTLDSSTAAITTPKLYVDASGNAIATWVQSDGTANSIWTSRYNAATNVWSPAVVVDDRTTIAADPAASINANGDAVVAWRQPSSGTTPNDLFFSKFTGGFSTGFWGTPYTIETRADNITAAPSMAVDPSGDIQVVWQQSDGTAASIFTNRYAINPNLYFQTSGEGWAAIATTLYGTANVADELQAALGNPSLSFDSSLGSYPVLGPLPRSLTDTVVTTFSVAPYYLVQAGDTWASISQALYGTSAFASQLQAFYGNVALAAGMHLTNVPGSFSTTAPQASEVPPYYVVRAGDTWASIAALLYGSASVSGALQTALGNPPLAPGTHLAGLPASLSDGTASHALVNAALSATDTTVTNYGIDAGALSTSQTLITNPSYGLNTSLTFRGADNVGAPTLLETGTAAASNPQVGFDGNGNGFALWQTSNDLLVRRYDAPSNTWGTTLTLDANANTITVPKLYVDASGNAIATWVQSDGTANSSWTSRYKASPHTWSAAVQVDNLITIAVDPVATINASGQAAIAWRQPAAGTTTPNNLMVARF